LLKFFRDNLAKIEGVVSVFAVSGDVDLMLEIVAMDMAHYSQVVMHDVFNTKGSRKNNFTFSAPIYPDQRRCETSKYARYFYIFAPC
jgi:DNA-binding Lrp family transcriptional regulator